MRVKFFLIHFFIIVGTIVLSAQEISTIKCSDLDISITIKHQDSTKIKQFCVVVIASKPIYLPKPQNNMVSSQSGMGTNIVSDVIIDGRYPNYMDNHTGIQFQNLSNLDSLIYIVHTDVLKNAINFKLVYFDSADIPANRIVLEKQKEILILHPNDFSLMNVLRTIEFTFTPLTTD